MTWSVLQSRSSGGTHEEGGFLTREAAIEEMVAVMEDELDSCPLGHSGSGEGCLEERKETAILFTPGHSLKSIEIIKEPA